MWSREHDYLIFIDSVWVIVINKKRVNGAISQSLYFGLSSLNYKIKHWESSIDPGQNLNFCGEDIEWLLAEDGLFVHIAISMQIYIILNYNNVTYYIGN